MNARKFSTVCLEKLANGDSRPFMSTESVFDNPSPHVFYDFKEIISFNYGDRIDCFFEAAENFLNRGYWLCGYFSYEFGYFLEPALYHLRTKNRFPLAWLGACKAPVPAAKKQTKASRYPQYEISNIKANISFGEYREQIKKIKYFLEEGQTYQVNFTFKHKFDFSGNAYALYQALKRSQPTAYGAMINTGADYILSFSPELFFSMDGKTIVSKPMKGTVQRGETFPEDEANRNWLSESKKIKAENVMIVDLLRNDLGRISERVQAPKLFEVEKYRTLYQMTSTIEAKIRNNIKISDVFFALFPCGSVTGAPKIRTMEIIRKLEKENRGVYTGAIGYISPQRKSRFNVAIRTIHLRKDQGELGVGGGIVYDSNANDEYKEAVLKAKFFIEGIPQVSLIESILWKKEERYWLLDLHLERLRKSSDYFSIPLRERIVRKRLESLEKKFMKNKEKAWKVRLLVGMEGEIDLETESLDTLGYPVTTMVSAIKINPQNIYIYHKTTQRCLYNEELACARQKGFFEVIFANNKDELTEGAISNIFIEKSGCLYTPPVGCGLLPGVLREYLIRSGKAREKVIKIEDLYAAEKVYIGNSVKGLVETKIFRGALVY